MKVLGVLALVLGVMVAIGAMLPSDEEGFWCVDGSFEGNGIGRCSRDKAKCEGTLTSLVSPNVTRACYQTDVAACYEKVSKMSGDGSRFCHPDFAACERFRAVALEDAATHDISGCKRQK